MPPTPKPRPASQSTNHIHLRRLSKAHPRWYQPPYMCHPRLSTPCPLCKEMQWPLRPPGKVGVSTAPPIKPSLGNSQIQQQEPKHPARRPFGNCNIACNINPLTCSSCHTTFHHSCSGLTRDADAAALARTSWICRPCTTTPSQLRQGPLQTNRLVSKPANRVSQSALRILQWNADGLSTKVHELRQRHPLEKIDICLIQETKLNSKDPTPAFPGFSAIRQDRP